MTELNPDRAEEGLADLINAEGKEAAPREVLTFLRTHTGRDFSCCKRATAVRRIARCMQINGTEDLSGDPGAPLGMSRRATRSCRR